MTSLPSPLQAVVALYSGPLQGVRFADIDGDGLSNLASEVEQMANEVEVQEAQLASLREGLAQKQELLLALAQQALAYARIYAEGDEALSAELNEIALPRATKPRKAASGKAASERGARASKELPEENGEAAGLDVEATPAASVESIKPKRKAVAVEVEAREEGSVSAKAGRRKLPVRTGRAAR